jgi:hypothetical protein
VSRLTLGTVLSPPFPAPRARAGSPYPRPGYMSSTELHPKSTSDRSRYREECRPRYRTRLLRRSRKNRKSSVCRANSIGTCTGRDQNKLRKSLPKSNSFLHQNSAQQKSSLQKRRNAVRLISQLSARPIRRLGSLHSRTKHLSSQKKIGVGNSCDIQISVLDTRRQAMISPPSPRLYSAALIEFSALRASESTEVQAITSAMRRSGINFSVIAYT